MQQTTQSILLAALKQDGSFTPSQITEAMAILAGKSQSGSETPSLLLTQAQVSRLLSCSRWSVKRLVQDGLLKPVQLRGLTRYRRVDIEQLAAGGSPDTKRQMAERLTVRPRFELPSIPR